MLHSTSMGSSDTELKLLAVMPTRLPAASRAVMTVTPVANWPSAVRNALESVCVFVMLRPVFSLPFHDRDLRKASVGIHTSNGLVHLGYWCVARFFFPHLIFP